MIAFPPQMRDGSPEAMVYRHIAQQCMFKMNQARGALPLFTQRFILNNGVEIICSYCYGKEDIWVKIPPVVVGTTEVEQEEVLSGFIFHPRSGGITLMTYYRHYMDYSTGTGVYIQENIRTHYGVAGGWSNGNTELAQSYLFPLVDSDNASMALTEKDGTDVTVFFERPGLYGNLYWTNDDEDDLEVLSWKGPPSRHGAVHHEYEIPGLSIVETIRTTATEDIPEFTVFSQNLYENGDLFAQAPRFTWGQDNSGTDGRSLILGAMRNAAGNTYIVTQNDHKNAPKYIWLFSNGEVRSGETESVVTDYLASVNNVTPAPNPYVSVVKKLELTKPGYFLGVWCDKFSDGAAFRTDGWELIAEFPYTRNRRAWFGNSSGTEFVCSNGDAVVIGSSGDMYTADYTAFVQADGASTQTVPSGNRYEVEYTLAANGIKYLYEYAGDEKKSGIAVLSFSASSIQTSIVWGEPTTITGQSGANAHYTVSFTDNSWTGVGYSPVCYIGLPYQAEPLAFEYTEIATNEPCILYDSFNNPLGTGRSTAVYGYKTTTSLVGQLPGTQHSVETDFTINVCGINIPIIKTVRSFLSERTPHTTADADNAGYVKSWIEESCDIQKSTIHFLDHRCGVCLYKTTHDIIVVPRKQSQEVSRYVVYGSTQRSATIIVRPEDYTATSTETWHLVIDGIATVVAKNTLELFPFGEPMNSYAYEDVCEVFCMPKIPSSAHVEPSSETNSEPAAAGDFGAYEDGYDDPLGEQAQADGGIDYFYPEWCRHLQADQFWAEAAANRYSFTMPGIESLPYGTIAYTPPEVTVEPMPIGSFARHPVLGDMYQFLIARFDGQKQVISSANINSFIDEQLALAKNEDGTSKGLATHDTTLYYPISLI